MEKLPDDQKDEFKAKAQPAIKFLLGKIKELQLYVLFKRSGPKGCFAKCAACGAPAIF